MTTNFPQSSIVQGVEYGTARAALSHTDLTTAGVAQTFAWTALVGAHPKGGVLPPEAEIVSVALVRGADFSGGGSATAVVTAGDAGDPDELLTALDVFTGAKATAIVSVANGVLTLPAFEAAYVATVTFTADVFVNLLTAGACEFRIVYRAYETSLRSI